jgi:tripartite-type tricarboxylate transporter receptor subunit TctC
MAGHVPVMFDGPANTLPMAKAGKVKVLAVSGAKRNRAACLRAVVEGAGRQAAM